jgi:hypothetical protein
MAKVLVPAWLAGFIILLYDVLSKPAVVKGIYSLKTFSPHLISLREYLYRAVKKATRIPNISITSPLDEGQNVAKTAAFQLLYFPNFLSDQMVLPMKQGTGAQ